MAQPDYFAEFENMFPRDLHRAAFRKALKRAEPTMFADAMRFLFDDPRTFNSGYSKEYIWRAIRRYPLTAENIAVLEQAALKYLQRPMSSEFKRMCITMSYLGTPAFWQLVGAKREDVNPVVRVTAKRPFAYSAGVHAGEKQRIESRYRYRSDHRQEQNRQWEENRTIHEAFISAVYDPENWPDGVIQYKVINFEDIPLMFSVRYDIIGEGIASVDIQLSKHENILGALNHILQLGTMSHSADKIWLQCMYLLQQIEDTRAIPIIVRFIQNKLAYKFESISKSILERAALQVLKGYGVPEAQAVLERYYDKK